MIFYASKIKVQRVVVNSNLSLTISRSLEVTSSILQKEPLKYSLNF